MDQISISSAYMWAIIVMAVFFLLAVLVANMILYKPNNPGTTQRRVWFWVFCVASAVIGFVINYFIGHNIDVPSLQSSYYMHSAIAAGVGIVIYVIAGFALSKIFSSSKIGTWF